MSMTKTEPEFRNPKLYEKYIERSFNKDRLTDDDRDLIMQYVGSPETNRKGRISLLTRGHKIMVLSQWRCFLQCEYRNVTVEDLDQADATIRSAKTRKGTPYKQNALNSMYRELRQFLHYLAYKKIIAVTSDDLRFHLTAPAYDPNTETAKDMLTDNEIKTLIAAAPGPREKAFIACLADSGGRFHEVFGLRWGDLVFDEDGGVETTLHSRKGTVERRTRVTWLNMARPYLAVWREAYPRRVEDDGYVFAQIRPRINAPLKYSTAKTMLGDIAKASGIKKRVHFHLFRKSRATGMAREDYDDHAVKLALWGNEGTRMQSVYVHLSGAEVTRKFKKKAGVRVDEAQATEPKTMKCIRCNAIVPVGAKICWSCGRDPAGSNAPTDARMQIAQAIIASPEFEAIMKNVFHIRDTTLYASPGAKVEDLGDRIRVTAPEAE